MTDRTVEVDEGLACGSSKSVTIYIITKKSDGKKHNHDVDINLTAIGKDLRARVSDLLTIEQECIELIYKGMKLDMEKPLSEQKIVNKAKIMVRKIDVKGREAEGHLSRIKKGVDILVRRGANLGKPYLKITNEKMEAVEVPEAERVAILKALVLHETGRDYMKPEKHDWNTALRFLMFAEDAFRECNKDYIKYVDNNGVLNLDILWCYLKLEKRDYLQDANKRLEAAEIYLNNAFEKNMDSDQEAEENSVRKKILFLQLYILWGMLFTFRSMKKEALNYLHKAEELCDELQLDDCDIAELRHQGLTRQEARIGLRACGGDLGKAKEFIEQRRQDRSQLNGTTEAASTYAQPVPAPNPTNVSEAEDEETLIEEIPAPNPTDVSEEDEETLIEEMLQLLPDSTDSYIDLSLEEEQAVIMHYKAMLTNPEAR